MKTGKACMFLLSICLLGSGLGGWFASAGAAEAALAAETSQSSSDIIGAVAAAAPPSPSQGCEDPPCFPCDGTDGTPNGAQLDHSCFMDTQCTCSPQTTGWCRRDKCDQ